MLAPNVAPPHYPFSCYFAAILRLWCTLLPRSNGSNGKTISASAETFVWERIKFAFYVVVTRRLKSNGPLESQHNRRPFFSPSPNICPMLLFLTHPLCPFLRFHSSASPSRLMTSLSCSILTYISTARFRARYLLSLLSAHLICWTLFSPCHLHS